MNIEANLSKESIQELSKLLILVNEKYYNRFPSIQYQLRVYEKMIEDLIGQAPYPI